jgi:3-hydroxymyristoyl/3-hydroxydecanoyl-(acyl carrier protein) dehydratase
MITVTDISFPSSHPALAGHFPGLPIVPGVVLLDAILNTIAAQYRVHYDRCTLLRVKFKSVMRPDQLATLSFEFSGPHCVRFELESADHPVVTGAVTFPEPRQTTDDR